MKIAIHQNNYDFTNRWVSYCKEKSIDYELVNCYDSDIIKTLKNCEALFWHHHHADYKDSLFAKRILFALNHSGYKVYPNFKTTWSFDDKLGQKYLLESLNIPFVKTYIFYSKKDALKWVKNIDYPIVFKISSGAGAVNVRLLKSKSEAKRVIRKAFGRGFKKISGVALFKDKLKKNIKGNGDIKDVVKSLGRILLPTNHMKYSPQERGYIYFQDFIKDNSFDIRVIVIKDKAFAIKRLVREDDFRASGSGKIVYKREEINLDCVKSAFLINKKLNMQSLAVDFIFNEGKPFVVEISYGWTADVYDSCPGYWDSELNWHEEYFNPYGWIIDNTISNS